MKELSTAERFQLYVDLENDKEHIQDDIAKAVEIQGSYGALCIVLAQEVSAILGACCTLHEREWLAKHKLAEMSKLHMTMMKDLEEVANYFEGSDDDWAEFVRFKVVDTADKIVNLLD